MLSNYDASVICLVLIVTLDQNVTCHIEKKSKQNSREGNYKREMNFKVLFCCFLSLKRDEFEFSVKSFNLDFFNDNT